MTKPLQPADAWPLTEEAKELLQQIAPSSDAGVEALAELGRVALRLAKDANYRHRAAEEILRLMEPLGAAISSNRRTNGGLTECDMHDDESN